MRIKYLILGFFALCNHAHSATWHFTNATIGPEHPITGSFDYSELHGYFNIDIQFADVAFTNKLGGNEGGLTVYGYTSHPIFRGLKFAWDEPLTDAGGVVNILHEQSWVSGLIDPNECSLDNVPYCHQLNPGGSVSAIPLPAAAWLFVSSIGSLGFLRRKSRQ